MAPSCLFVYTVTMYAQSLKKLIPATLILATLIFFSWSLIGPIHTLGMQMNDAGQMSGCVFGGICTMNTLEHLTAWQSLFNVVPAGIVSVSLLSIALIFVTFSRKFALQNFVTSNSTRRRLYIYSRKNFLFARVLQEAFSRGILNTKIY